MISALLIFEYTALNFFPDRSLLKFAGYTVSPEPGRSLSLFLGWAGISLMLVMNLYILRKRFELVGSLSSWLNFHIFCGLAGPTFILFHCNFKVRGLVAISFWSMLISATSGVVGRYFYVQIIGLKKELVAEAERWSKELAQLQGSAIPPVSDDTMDKLKKKALTFAGVTAAAVGTDGTLRVNALHIFFSSIMGDLRLLLDLPRTVSNLPSRSRVFLKRYALAERKALFLEPFRRLMGHWHTFHTPFAIFMYITAIIHIAAALVLGAKH